MAQQRSAPAVERAIGILKALARSSHGLRLSDLSRELGLNKSTAFQILQVLEHHALVERHADTLRYRLGYGLVELSNPVLGRLDLRTVARPVLRRLARETGQTVFMAARDGDRIVIVDKEESAADMKITSPVGRRLPLTAGSLGLVFLAYGSAEDVASVLETPDPKRGLRRFTQRTMTDPDGYRRALEETRQRGYSFDDEEYLDGVRGISAPVFGPHGELAAALAVVGFSSAMPDQRLAEMIEATRRAAAAVSRGLGAEVPAAVASTHLIPSPVPGRPQGAAPTAGRPRGAAPTDYSPAPLLGDRRIERNGEAHD